jgi:hypothetical protein
LMVFVSSNGLPPSAVNFHLPGSIRCWDPATQQKVGFPILRQLAYVVHPSRDCKKDAGRAALR